MAHLSLAEDLFFETPPDVAAELAHLALTQLGLASSITLVDACSGSGALSQAFVAAAAPAVRVRLALVESNAALRGSTRLDTLPGDVQLDDNIFSQSAAYLVRQADIVLMNPPFAGARGIKLSPALAALQRTAAYPDIGCHYILHVLQRMRPGAFLALVFRKNAFVSRAYDYFRKQLAALGSVIAFRDIGRRLRPGSGSAEAILAIVTAKIVSSKCWLRRRDENKVSQDNKLSEIGWCRLGDLARVRAGPSIRTEMKHRLSGGDCLSQVMTIPRLHDGCRLWGAEFSFKMSWIPATFSVARNLGFQGRPGFVYKLAGSNFRTAILPIGYTFLSSTPAVIPNDSRNIDFVTGCSLLPRWRKFVRESVSSSNFTPNAIEDVFVPFYDPKLCSLVAEAGRLAREEVYSALTSHALQDVLLSSTLYSKLLEVDGLTSQSLSV